jgi:uncharacterized membrane protein
MDWFEHLEHNLSTLVIVARFCLETLSALCVIVGLVKTIRLALRTSYRWEIRPFNQVRISFGSWLALALEFQLGADVLSTTIAPTLEELTKLALIAIIRTFLNYFLSKELEAEYELQQQQAELTAKQSLAS